MSSRGEESVFPAPRLGARRAPPAKVATHSLKPTNKSWRVDETYVRVKGGWCYLYRAIDSTGATIDFLLSALRDAAAAKRLFRKALSDPSHPQPRVINTDARTTSSARRPPYRTIASNSLFAASSSGLSWMMRKGLGTSHSYIPLIPQRIRRRLLVRQNRGPVRPVAALDSGAQRSTSGACVGRC